MLDLKSLSKEKLHSFQTGQEIKCSGGPERAMYILLSGRVGVSNGDAPRSHVNPGEAFGGNEFFNGGKAVYIAEAGSICYAITEASFLNTAQKRPELVYEILKAAYRMPVAEKSAAIDARSNAAKEVPQAAPKAAEPTPAEPESVQEAGSVASPPVIAVEIPKAPGGVSPEGHKRYPGVTHPEYEKLVYKKNYKCPNCGKTFDDFKVFKSKLVLSQPLRYDLRACYTGFQMEWYEIVTCPHCLFSMFHNYFTEPKPLLKEKLKETLAAARNAVRLDFAAQRDIDFVFTAHYLALACAQGYTSPRRHILAKIWANLSWLYEDVGDEDMARYAAGECANAYDELFAGSNLSLAQEQSISLTIAGMMYRAGQKENLKKYLFIAKTSKAGNRTYSILAEDLMEEIRAEK